MFTRHWLTVTQFQWDSVAQPNNWITLIFCVLLLLFTIIVVAFRRKLFLICRALVSQRHFSLVQREVKILEERSSLLLLVFDLLTITTGLVMFGNTYLSPVMSRLPFIANVGICFGVLLSAFFLKLLCNQLYATLYGRQKESAAMNQYKFSFMTNFAILLFPMLIIIHYMQLRTCYYILAVILALLFLTWAFQLMKNNSINGRGFHFFLYFCTLEILPWLVGLKFILII